MGAKKLINIDKKDNLQMVIDFDQRKTDNLVKISKKDIYDDLSDMPDIPGIPDEIYFPNEDSFQEENLSIVIPKINNGINVNIPDHLSKYVDILLDINRRKIEEFVLESGMSNVVLSESDVKLCFDLAVKEYNYLYPDTLKNNTIIVNLAEKLI